MMLYNVIVFGGVWVIGCWGWGEWNFKECRVGW